MERQAALSHSGIKLRLKLLESLLANVEKISGLAKHLCLFVTED
jgi:hypothetical protein